ncbi:hypothetical protein RFM26_18530 [Mesorhizobium sp. VK23B]|uniref:Uncharacterized protein n=1 Tax=Mesorhizobium dulcispinae TaxID=3072316 RepID=A0ABU4XGY7_9HYPH|nr:MULTISPECIES: hypothetical protein [unclassified Mesorhizobium]MDX8467692.1 hypothetical protein [Mesorhizobium sp. VK23B]MDX8474030.1 hypothetical protein [Mesorhizobium sp. VK23A]
MTTYDDLDGIIGAWVKATGSTLFTEWAGQPARFFHIGGTRSFECFQISIGLPDYDEVAVRAWAIDTYDDSEMEMDRTWNGRVSELNEMLGTAVATVQDWKARWDNVH